jgi:hydroxymethylpyrimidine kinase/phosphomethylpyrimidine kinase/thiamine-phosphate diphosphorylase
MGIALMDKIVWTIGGSDSSGGAGIQADTLTFNNLGAHGCSVITAVTAQNTLGVTSIEAVSSTMLQAQIDSLLADLPPKAIKTGMLYSRDNIKLVSKLLSKINTFKICDPVMVSTSGSSLLSNENIVQAFIEFILPHTDLLTPNIPEAETLLRLEHSSVETRTQTYIKDLANKLLALGPKAILLKGGHSDGPLSNDYFLDQSHSVWLSCKRILTKSTHGTGCTLSAAIAAAVSLDYPLIDALVIAKAYVHQGLRLAKTIGKGHGPIAHGQWPENSVDLPVLIPDSTTGLLEAWLNNPAFPDCGKEALGVYPIVDSSAWLEKLLPEGISTAQLRIKSNGNNSKYIEEEIIKAIKIGKRFSCRLFINDYWQLAIKYGAYGVHLGQEDLDTVDLNALIKSGMRLGLSTHSYAEVARTLAYKPSYIAIGPIYDTTTKVMSWIPQGLENLKRWRRSLDYPLVAIAGINLERLPGVVAAGADGVAVIRDIVNNQDPIGQTKAWLKTYANSVNIK